jgi:hypothetical protein
VINPDKTEQAYRPQHSCFLSPQVNQTVHKTTLCFLLNNYPVRRADPVNQLHKTFGQRHITGFNQYPVISCLFQNFLIVACDAFLMITEEVHSQCVGKQDAQIFKFTGDIFQFLPDAFAVFFSKDPEFFLGIR